MRVNVELLRARATALRENIARVHEISSLPDEQFWSSELHIEALKLRLIQAIEDASSISAHLLSRLGGSAPAGYVECFAGIHRRGVIDETLAERLQAMARFRNLLVHRYWQVDDAEVLRFGAGVLCYDAWGQLMVGTNSMLYGYKGQWGYYADSETGWLLLTHRYLDPTTGRFLTRDPLPMIHPLRPLRIKAYTEAGNVVEWKKPYLLKVGVINEQL